jgi:hypothetical protein
MYNVRSYYDTDFRGLEDSIKNVDIDTMENFVWEKIMQGNYVEIEKIESGETVRIDSDNLDYDLLEFEDILDMICIIF